MAAPRPRVLAAALALVALAALGGCGGDEDDTSSAPSTTGAGEKAPFSVPGEAVATDKVNLPRSYKFDPAVIKVKAGTSVTWANKDDFPHNVHLVGRNEQTRDLPIGGTASITFDEPGTYYYQCTFHPAQMKGKVVVES